MRRLGVIAILMGALALSSAQADAARTVCMNGRHGCVVRPHVIAVGARSVLRGVHWESWGWGRAVGHGKFVSPATATEDRYGPYPAKIIVSEIGECQGRFWYSRVTIKIGRSYGKTLENNEPFGPCYYP